MEMIRPARDLRMQSSVTGERQMRILPFVAACIVSALAVPASAAPISTTVNFSLSGFLDINSAVPVPPSVSSITGSFTVNFDPTLFYNNDTTDITVNTFAGTTVDSALGFTYNAGSHYFFFGGLQNNADFVVVGTNDFVLSLDMTDTANPTLILCNAPGIICGAQTGNGTYAASGYTATSSASALWFISAPDSTVTTPEPMSLALLGAGAAGLAAVRRRRPTR
jgi:hypothetical protein